MLTLILQICDVSLEYLRPFLDLLWQLTVWYFSMCRRQNVVERLPDPPPIPPPIEEKKLFLSAYVNPTRISFVDPNTFHT